VEKVVYSHCHGKERFDDSFKGYVNGIEYKLVSGVHIPRNLRIRSEGTERHSA
jgi:predicted phosphohydrolase